MTRALAALLLLATVARAGPEQDGPEHGPGAAVKAAAADLARLESHLRQFQGYFWHPGSRAVADEFDAVFRLHVNRLSRKGAIRPPERVAWNLWRVDLRFYGWDRAVWDKMEQGNFVFIEQRPKPLVRVTRSKSGRVLSRSVVKFAVPPYLPARDIAFLIEETGSPTPIVLAPWFLANTIRQLTLDNRQLGYGYYDWLRVKKPQDFLDLSKVRLGDSIVAEKDILEVMDESGISKQNRSIEAHPSLAGIVFYTRDTDDETGRGNAIQNLRRGDFKAKAREWYIPLPNGLDGYLLSDDELKELQASAPDFIGADNSPLNQSRDQRIHVGIGCIRCHAGEVLKPIDGWARKNYTLDRLALLVPALFKGFDPDKQFAIYEELSRQYLKLNLNNALNLQRNAYRLAIEDACGLTPQQAATLTAKHYHTYVDSPVTIDQAARELGYTTSEVRGTFRRFSSPPPLGTGSIHPQLGALALVPSQPIKRLHWEQLYRDAAQIMLSHRVEVLD